MELALDIIQSGDKDDGKPGDTGTQVGVSASVRRSYPYPYPHLYPYPAAAAARATRLRVRGRAAGLDLAGQLDRQLQGLRHLCGSLRRLWVLKLRACGSTSVDGWTWWACVRIPVPDCGYATAKRAKRVNI